MKYSSVTKIFSIVMYSFKYRPHKVIQFCTKICKFYTGLNESKTCNQSMLSIYTHDNVLAMKIHMTRQTNHTWKQVAKHQKKLKEAENRFRSDNITLRFDQ